MSDSLVTWITELLGPAASASMHQLQYGTVELMDCVNACSARREYPIANVLGVSLTHSQSTHFHSFSLLLHTVMVSQLDAYLIVALTVAFAVESV